MYVRVRVRVCPGVCVCVRKTFMRKVSKERVKRKSKKKKGREKRKRSENMNLFIQINRQTDR